MNEAGGYDGILFAYKKEVDERSGASGCVRLGIFTFSTHNVACSHRAVYSCNIVRAASPRVHFPPKRKRTLTVMDRGGCVWVGGWRRCGCGRRARHHCMLPPTMSSNSAVMAC